MNTNTTLVMFAIIAAFGLVVLPITQQAHAAHPLQACKPPFHAEKSPCAKGPPS